MGVRPVAAKASFTTRLLLNDTLSRDTWVWVLQSRDSMKAANSYLSQFPCSTGKPTTPLPLTARINVYHQEQPERLQVCL